MCVRAQARLVRSVRMYVYAFTKSLACMCVCDNVLLSKCVYACICLHRHVCAGMSYISRQGGRRESFEFEPLAQLIRRVREKAWLSPSRERKESFSMSPWICGCFS